MDFNLPDYSGTALIAMLNEISDSLTPILMLTGAGSEDIAVEAMRAGAADDLPKRLVSADSLKRTIVMAMNKFETIKAINLRTRRLEKMNADFQRKQDVIERLHNSSSNDDRVQMTSIHKISRAMLNDENSMTDKQKDSKGGVSSNSQAINDELYNSPSVIKSGNEKYTIE